MGAPWSQEWFDDCQKYYGRVLSGVYSHWCPQAHDMPLDETDGAGTALAGFHWHWCDCFRCKCGALMKPRQYPFGREIMQMHDDFFDCPRRRFWNFWKHRPRDKGNRMWKI